jgi:hypothetical protein
MNLVYFGLAFTGLLMAVTASGVISVLRQKFRKNPFGKRIGPKVKTTIQMHKENQNES